MPDDHTADIQTTGRLGMGGSTTGEIETAGDRDWFAVELVAGRTYVIDLEGSPTGDDTLANPYLHGIHDSGGVLLAGTTDDDGGTGRNSRLTFTAKQSGTYYVAAGAHGAETGSYTLRVADETPVADDFTDTAATAGTVAVGGLATGRIGTARDVDWFALDVVAGRTYVIDLEGSETDAGTLVDPQLRGLFDADGNRLPVTTREKDGGEGLNSRMTWTATETGTVYVAARGHRDGTGTYTVRVTDPDAATRDDGSGTNTDRKPVVRDDDFTDDANTTGTVTVGGSVRGEIEAADDVDWFEVVLEADKIYQIDLKGVGTQSLSDPYLRGIYDSNSNLIAGTQNDDFGAPLDSRVYFTATAAGTHYVAAGGADGVTGTYRLSVKEIEDDYTADTDTTGTVSVGGSVGGVLESASDRDWFAVTLVAGTTYQIDLLGHLNASSTIEFPHLYGVHDSNGDLIPGTTDADFEQIEDSRVYFTPTDDDTYYVAAGSNANETGTYNLLVKEAVDDFTADIETSGAVEVNDSAEGRIDFTADQDWFEVEMVAGTYRIDLKLRTVTLPLLEYLTDPYLRGVHDSMGMLIAGTSDNDSGSGKNSRIFFTAPEDATYYVAAGGNEVPKIHTGPYTLSVTGIPDIAADTSTTGTVAVGGREWGAIDTADDQDWFAVELEAGKTYEIFLEGADTAGTTLADPYLRGVHDSMGILIAGTTNDNIGRGDLDSRLYFRATEDGTHFVAAGGAAAIDRGAYWLSVTQIDDDFTADVDTEGRAVVGQTSRGEIDYAGDRDWFEVVMGGTGRPFQIDIEGFTTGAGTLNTPALRGIYDEDGERVPDTRTLYVGGGAGGQNTRVMFEQAEAAPGIYYARTYYLEVGGGGGDLLTGTYTLLVRDARDVTDDFAANPQTTGTVAVDGFARGEIESRNDRDWFAVELEADQTVRIDLEGRTTSVGSLSNPYLHGVYDEHETLMPGTTDNDGGRGQNSRVDFTAPADGTYYVAAGSIFNAEGTYRLSVRDVTDDFEADDSTTGMVSVGGAATGEIELADDHDWFAVELDAGTTYRFDLQGSTSGAGTPSDPQVRGVHGTLDDPYLRGIHDEHGTLVAGTTDDDSGTWLNSRVHFTPTAGGTYYVAAGDSGDKTGTYTLSVSVAERDDDFTANTETTGRVSVGSSVEGKLETWGDHDWIAVDLDAGKSYRFDLEGIRNLSDPYLWGIYDATGKLIPRTSNDNISPSEPDSRVEFTPPTTGTYYVAASAFDDWDRGAYTLSVEEVM